MAFVNKFKVRLASKSDKLQDETLFARFTNGSPGRAKCPDPTDRWVQKWLRQRRRKAKKETEEEREVKGERKESMLVAMTSEQ